MKKPSNLKKFIPLSILIHTGAIFSAGFLAVPTFLNTQTIEMSVDSEQGEQESLGIDVIATQGDQSPIALSKVESIETPVEDINTNKEAVTVAAPTPVKKSVAAKPVETKSAVEDNNLKPSMTEDFKPTQSIAETFAPIEHEELSLPAVAPEETAQNISPIAAGANGEDTPSSELAGTAHGVKSLEQIRQLSGNPKPRYDRAERLRGDSGTVVFRAYISNTGQPAKIEKVSSSGHANLDQKSLAALSKWKFAPGQEGWVEVPFKWELKGPVSQDTLKSASRSEAQ